MGYVRIRMVIMWFRQRALGDQEGGEVVVVSREGVEAAQVSRSEEGW